MSTSPSTSSPPRPTATPTDAAFQLEAAPNNRCNHLGNIIDKFSLKNIQVTSLHGIQVTIDETAGNHIAYDWAVTFEI